MEKMLAAVFEDVGKLELKMVPVPRIQREDQVLVEVEAVSICGTDVHITAVPPGYEAVPGTILGHELVGKIIEKGEAVEHLQIGDRVVVNPNDYCGVCRYCRKNLPNLCENIIPLGIDYHGALQNTALYQARQPTKSQNRYQPRLPRVQNRWPAQSMDFIKCAYFPVRAQ